MKASELRIGNWVCDIYQEEEFQLDIVDMCDMDINGDLYRTDPIPLTEEWLLKFKFKKDLDGSFVYGLLSMFKDKRLKQNVYIYTEDTNKGQWVVINDLKLQYVHQLQNLYHALTGEELTIKEL
jgi:hypothetical protein